MWRLVIRPGSSSLLCSSPLGCLAVACCSSSGRGRDTLQSASSGTPFRSPSTPWTGGWLFSASFFGWTSGFPSSPQSLRSSGKGKTVSRCFAMNLSRLTLSSRTRSLRALDGSGLLPAPPFPGLAAFLSQFLGQMVLDFLENQHCCSNLSCLSSEDVLHHPLML